MISFDITRDYHKESVCKELGLKELRVDWFDPRAPNYDYIINGRWSKAPQPVIHWTFEDGRMYYGCLYPKLKTVSRGRWLSPDLEIDGPLFEQQVIDFIKATMK